MPPQLASLAFGEREPTSVLASGHLNQHGVDKTTGLTLTYEGGGVASLCCSIGCEMPNEALICGESYPVRHVRYLHSVTHPSDIWYVRYDSAPRA